jgi:hypothetical protein
MGLLSVGSELLPDGSYGVGIAVGDDRAFVLDREQAVAYAVACIARATEADHITALMRLLMSLEVGLSSEQTAAFVSETLDGDNGEHRATAPLQFMPGVSGARAGDDYRAAILVGLDEEPVGQMDPEALRLHGTGVLSCLALADLDAGLHRALREDLGLPERVARLLVSSLLQHMPRPPDDAA